MVYNTIEVWSIVQIGILQHIVSRTSKYKQFLFFDANQGMLKISCWNKLGNLIYFIKFYLGNRRSSNLVLGINSKI